MQVKKYVLVLVAMSLGGCASIENLLKERREAKEQAYVLKEQAKISSAQEACKRFGFSEKTNWNRTANVAVVFGYDQREHCIWTTI